jgi:endonuclease
MKRYNVVFPRDDGGVEVYAMKEWLRQHPDSTPNGLDPTQSTSQQLRNGLRKMGWTVQETNSEFRLFPPGAAVSEGPIEAVLGENEEADDSQEEPAAFGLEYQLRDFIAQNIAAIPVGGKKLRVYVDPTAVGPIDILALDGDGNFVVFELKRARSPDHAIGQISRYMGWITQTIGRGKGVTGVIVAKTISENLRYSLLVVPNVSLFEYEVKFELKGVSPKEG